jgi:glycosyltransferase involved in cell wall biosynthesis
VREDWKVILLVSRISKWKRHDLALKMFRKVASSDPDAHLVCVGAQDELEPRWWALLQEISSTSAFADRIHWIGHVEDVRPWYRAAHLLILPSDHEPFGRVLVEAMASGVPVVATRSGGVPEIVRSGQDGFLVPIDHSDAFADAVLMIMKDEGLRAALSESAVRRANDFGIDRYVQGVFDVFQENMPHPEMRFAP